VNSEIRSYVPRDLVAFLSTRRYRRALYAMALCPSVCPSQAGVQSKRLILSSRNPQPCRLWFRCKKSRWNFVRITLTGAPNAGGGWAKIAFLPFEPQPPQTPYRRIVVSVRRRSDTLYASGLSLCCQRSSTVDVLFITLTVVYYYTRPSIVTRYIAASWWRGPAVERWSLADVLSLSCARLVADG